MLSRVVWLLMGLGMFGMPALGQDQTIEAIRRAIREAERQLNEALDSRLEFAFRGRAYRSSFMIAPLGMDGKSIVPKFIDPMTDSGVVEVSMRGRDLAWTVYWANGNASQRWLLKDELWSHTIDGTTRHTRQWRSGRTDFGVGLMVPIPPLLWEYHALSLTPAEWLRIPPDGNSRARVVRASNDEATLEIIRADIPVNATRKVSFIATVDLRKFDELWLPIRIQQHTSERDEPPWLQSEMTHKWRVFHHGEQRLPLIVLSKRQDFLPHPDEAGRNAVATEYFFEMDETSFEVLDRTTAPSTGVSDFDQRFVVKPSKMTHAVEVDERQPLLESPRSFLLLFAFLALVLFALIWYRAHQRRGAST